MQTGIYPGTFDPITLGHLDVLDRARKIFNHVIVAVADNLNKEPLFSLEERMELVHGNVDSRPGVEVDTFNGLIVDYARSRNAVALIRGLRAVSDFEYEFQMAQMNRHLDPGIETVYLMTTEKYFFTSSTLVKQVSRYSVRDTQYVPPNVLQALKNKFEPAT